LLETIQMMSHSPARIMGIADQKGSLAPGKDADIVIFNAGIEIQETFVMGRSVYQA
jgi:N-acetylglucosamine-6-phosphate deacetylase